MEDPMFATQLRLEGKVNREEAPPPKNAVSIQTNDEESFPVREPAPVHAMPSRPFDAATRARPNP